MTSDVHVSAPELDAGLPDIERAPSSEGTVELIVRRPAEGERHLLYVASPGTRKFLQGWMDRYAAWVRAHQA